MSLGEGLVCGGIGKFVGAVGSTVVDEEFPAFHTTVIVIQEFAFSVEELRALFAGSERDSRCLAVVVWNMT